MKEFLVSWEIELKAANAKDAAKLAWEILRKPGSTANVFQVWPENADWPEKVDIQELLDSGRENSREDGQPCDVGVD